MSSIVSRKPPFSTSTSQAKDFFWISIRLGTSIDLSRRANVRRVREAEAKTATPRGRRSGAGERGLCRRHTGATANIACDKHPPCTGMLKPDGPVRARLPYVAGRALWTLPGAIVAAAGKDDEPRPPRRCSCPRGGRVRWGDQPGVAASTGSAFLWLLCRRREAQALQARSRGPGGDE